MSRAIAIRISSQAVLAAVVRTSGARVVAEHVANVPVADGDSPAEIGERLAAALAPAKAGRAPAVVSLPRTELHWATYDLPPAPDNELPMLVQLQAQRDIVLADDGLGFDYVSLHGDSEHPHQVLAFGVSPNQLERIRAICTAADIKLQRLVPEAFGWFELSRRIAADSGVLPDRSALALFAAMSGRQAAVWAIENESLRLVRTVWLSAEQVESDDVSALASELRRTLLSIAPLAGSSGGQVPCIYVGENADTIAGELAADLGRPVRSMRLEDMVETTAAPPAGVTHADLAPLAAMAGALGANQRSPVDLLHPHRPPAPPSKRRMYVLAGAAAASVALAVGWTMYGQLVEPRDRIAAADTQRQALAEQLEKYDEIRKQAAEVDAWLAQSTNLLTELDYLAQKLRPQPLSDPEFNSNEDLILTKLTLAGRTLTIDGAARSTDALAPIESRLRGGQYAAIRGVVEESSESTPGYSTRMSEVLTRPTAAEVAAAATTAGGAR